MALILSVIANLSSPKINQRQRKAYTSRNSGSRSLLFYPPKLSLAVTGCSPSGQFFFFFSVTYKRLARVRICMVWLDDKIVRWDRYVRGGPR